MSVKKACEWRRKHPASLPPILSISGQRKATHWVRQCQTLVRIAPPAPHSFFLFLPVSLLSFHSVSLYSHCHLASVFGRGLHKSWTAGKRGLLIEKEIRNENSHSFSGLCSVKVWKCTRGKKTKCTEESGKKKIGHVLKTKQKRRSLTSRLSLHYL